MNNKTTEESDLDIEALPFPDKLAQIKHYRKLIAANPSDVDALTNLGRIYVQIRNFNKALESLNAALTIVTSKQGGGTSSKNLKIQNAMAVAYIQLGDYSKAREYLEKALNFDERNKDVLNNLGILYTRTGKIEEAIVCFLKILEDDDRDIPTLRNLAELYKLVGDYDESLRYRMRVLELSDER